MTDDNLAERALTSFSFGPFTLVPSRQLLLQGEVPVRIGGRALDILTALVERPGELVSKRELMVRAWPSINVDDSNLKVNMAALRRILGNGPGAQSTLRRSRAGLSVHCLRSTQRVVLLSVSLLDNAPQQQFADRVNKDLRSNRCDRYYSTGSR